MLVLGAGAGPGSCNSWPREVRLQGILKGMSVENPTILFSLPRYPLFYRGIKRVRVAAKCRNSPQNTRISFTQIQHPQPPEQSISRCRKCPICAPFSPRGNFWCRKTLFLTPNPTAPQLPVQKMPHLCTIFTMRQLLVQKRAVYLT